MALTVGLQLPTVQFSKTYRLGDTDGFIPHGATNSIWVIVEVSGASFRFPLIAATSQNFFLLQVFKSSILKGNPNREHQR